MSYSLEKTFHYVVKKKIMSKCCWDYTAAKISDPLSTDLRYATMLMHVGQLERKA